MNTGPENVQPRSKGLYHDRPYAKAHIVQIFLILKAPNFPLYDFTWAGLEWMIYLANRFAQRLSRSSVSASKLFQLSSCADWCECCPMVHIQGSTEWQMVIRCCAKILCMYHACHVYKIIQLETMGKKCPHQSFPPHPTLQEARTHTPMHTT